MMGVGDREAGPEGMTCMTYEAATRPEGSGGSLGEAGLETLDIF